MDNTAGFISSAIRKCELMKLKFAEGTSQHTLLVNRIKALCIAQALLEHDSGAERYTLSDMEKALPPIVSIINKTEKARSKYGKDTVYYRRFAPILRAMYISKNLIEAEISKRCR